MIGFDLSDITNVYVGSTPQSAIYLGSLLVWPKNTADKYLTFELIEPSQFAVVSHDTAFDSSYIAYSIDNGATWTNIMAQAGITPTFPAGTRILWKGDLSGHLYYSQAYGYYFAPGTGFFSFDNTQYVSVSGRYNVSGNPASLYYGDNFVGNTTIYRNMYAELFTYNTKLISAKNMALPATTLAYGCYADMFGGCSNMTLAPELPATTLAEKCYYYMFSACTSLTSAPALPATTLSTECYKWMFSSCQSLTSAPVLPATTLAYNCYAQMFAGCIALTAAPALPATTLAEGCYFGMFEYCINLTTAPELPATTLATSCYGDMFRQCTSLLTAPVLPATTLVDSCYSCMFYESTSVNNVTCLATDISANNCTSDWLWYVAASGTFTKAASMSSWTTGVSGIPSGWTVQDAS